MFLGPFLRVCYFTVGVLFHDERDFQIESLEAGLCTHIVYAHSRISSNYTAL